MSAGKQSRWGSVAGNGKIKTISINESSSVKVILRKTGK